MKRTFKTALVLVLALVLTVQTPLQALAQAAQPEGPDYVSEVKVFMGGDAEKELKAEGFIPLLGDDGKPVDLNQGAEGDWGSQGKKKVLMGYKTTKLQSQAITDLAVMNMEGGYSVPDYELLMKRYMGGQISPFIDKFLLAINEYRENLKSGDAVNKQRAEYIRTALNKFTDDDCAGAGLGDLLVNETVYEMARPKFDKLSEKDKQEIGIAAVNAQAREAIPKAERNQHCDILTLFAQADGQILLVIYDLITRGADTSEDSWIDRFVATSYDELLESYEMPEEDAKQQMARDFEDDAQTILKNWEAFRSLLGGAEEAADTLEHAQAPDGGELQEKLDALDADSSSAELGSAMADVLDYQIKQSELINLAAEISVADYLESIDYGDGTLYDFFTRSGTEVADDITSLYPMVAALSEGQRAGVEFISLRELVMLGNRDVAYSSQELEKLTVTSVYAGVDRAIFQQGGVALTSDTLRTRALDRQQNQAERSWLGAKMIVLYSITGACALGFIGSVFGHGLLSADLQASKELVKALEKKEMAIRNDIFFAKEFNDDTFDFDQATQDLIQNDVNAEKAAESVETLTASTATAQWMAVGFAVATLFMASVSLYMTWRELKDYYKVDFAVIPHYMVDEASITYYNANHELMVDNDFAAYYKAVTCNRSKNDKNYKALTDCADLNGDVGKQWVALYACRDNKVMPPILADSLKAVVGSTGVPAGYTKAIHMFGSKSAFNMNNKLYVWDQKAAPVFVYYKLDDTAPLSPRTSGAAFAGGALALAGAGGLALGALITALSMNARRKKKDDPAAA